ncbi:BLUF domain-containing protein [Sphingomonas adhaesiva]|uniref:BLUF domain-containing protein n=1 Tax=Sphingomonas adhaesiva TaxID=28212 RepID=UPI002FF7D186
MLQLIYTSLPVGRIDLTRLCEECVSKNIRDEITGVLAEYNGFYLQVLEGPQVPVEDAFVRIISDQRHKELQLLSRRLVTVRGFGHFAMAEVSDNKGQRQIIDAVRPLLANAPENWRTLFESRFGDPGFSRPR